MYRVWYYPQFQASTGALDVFPAGKGANAMYGLWYVTTWYKQVFLKKRPKDLEAWTRKKRINTMSTCLKTVILKNE